MNDYTMIHLAADRGHEFLVEAQQQRLANAAGRHRPARPERTRAGRHFSLGRLLRRISV